MKGDYGMKYERKDPNDVRKLDEARNTSAKVLDINPRSIAIVDEVRKEYTLSEEIAILRKALAYMGCDLPEFVKYNSDIEEAKARVPSND